MPNMGWLTPGNTFIPEATGQTIDPLEMPEEQADAIFGKPLMDALRAYRDNPILPPNKYVQLIRVPNNKEQS